MESFSYQNIFETKGIEYIFIILFFAILIPFWLILNKRTKELTRVREALSLSLQMLKIPQGLHLSRNHTWMHLKRSGTARVGLDDLLMHITGAVNIRFIANAGAIINKGQLLAEIDREGKKLQIYSPISGVIEKTNISLLENPEIMNNDPFNKGWVYEIKPSRWIADTRSCYLAEESSKWMKNEFNRFKEFILTVTGSDTAHETQIILQDGGELCDHTMSQLPKEVWEDFQEKFLSA
ncbi:MAG: glycine cleavage system protein H [Bacteroidales bacterium]|nr:glycine cleavage system protein H [Bacteroidales bacterium]